MPAVVKVERVTLGVPILGMTVIGAACISYDNGGAVFALLVSSPERPHLVQAVYFEKGTNVFRTMEVVNV